MKASIARVGATASGPSLYTFRYKGDSAVYQGVMAQDELQAKPDAAVTSARGCMAAD